MKTNKFIAIGLLTMTSVVAGCKVHSAENPPTPVKANAVEMIFISGRFTLLGQHHSADTSGFVLQSWRIHRSDSSSARC